MQLTIKGKNVKVSDERKEMIERKLGKLDHYIDRIIDATVELTAETANRQAGDRLSVELTLHLPNGIILRAEERNNQLQAALDLVYDKMQRQITRYKGRLLDHKSRGYNKSAANGLNITLASQRAQAEAEEDLDEDDKGPVIVRTKNFEITAMSPESAVEQMELLAHDFFIFEDDASGRVSIVYRRDDGTYGLLQPNSK